MKIFKITALLVSLFAFSLTTLSANPAIIAHALREMGADFTLSHAEIETRFNNTKFADNLPKETEPDVAIIEALQRAENNYVIALDNSLVLLSYAFKRDLPAESIIPLALSLLKPAIQEKNKIIAAELSKKCAPLALLYRTILRNVFPEKHVSLEMARLFTIKITCTEIGESLTKEAAEKVRLAKSLYTDKEDLRYIEKYGRPFYCGAVVNFKIDDLLTRIEKAFLRAKSDEK